MGEDEEIQQLEGKIQKLTRPELYEYCRQHSIKGYYGKTKVDQIKLILKFYEERDYFYDEEVSKFCCECEEVYIATFEHTFTNDVFAKNYGYEKGDIFASFVCKFCGSEFYRKAVKDMSEKERKKYNITRLKL